jgi:hypothetical protein
LGGAQHPGQAAVRGHIRNDTLLCLLLAALMAPQLLLCEPTVSFHLALHIACPGSNEALRVRPDGAKKDVTQRHTRHGVLA